MGEKEFRERLGTINKKLESNLIGIIHRKTNVFIMPISLIVPMNTEGLIKVWNTVTKMNKMGYVFDKI